MSNSLDGLSPTVSLVERTGQFLLGAQRGRACRDGGQALCDRWRLIGPPQDVSHEFGPGYLAWGIAFENKLLSGVRLIMVPSTFGPPKGCTIFCVYGCTKDNLPRWFTSHS